jgi:hypothetical protein
MPNPRKHRDPAARQKAYRERKKAEAEAAASPSAAKPEAAKPSAASPDDSAPSPVMQAVLATNPNASTLAAIRDDEDALNADRLRAAVELGKLEAAAADHHPGGSKADELRELRATIEALPVGDRLAWLRGEVAEHRAAGAYANEEEE